MGDFDNDDQALVAPDAYDQDEAYLAPDLFNHLSLELAISHDNHPDDALSAPTSSSASSKLISSTEKSVRTVWRLLGSSGEAGSVGGQTLHILCKTNATHKCQPESLTIMSSAASSDLITVQLILMLMLVVLSFVWAFFCRKGDERRRRSRLSMVLNNAASNLARKMSPHFTSDLPPAYSKLDLSKEGVLSVDDHLNPPPSYSCAQSLIVSVPTIVHVEDETISRRPSPPRRRKTGTNLLFVNPHYLNVPDESLRKASFSSLPMPFDEMISRRLMRRRSFSEAAGPEVSESTPSSLEVSSPESLRRHSSIEGAILNIKRRLSYLAFSS